MRVASSVASLYKTWVVRTLVYLSLYISIFVPKLGSFVVFPTKL